MNLRGVIAAAIMAILIPAARAAGPFGDDRSGIPMTSSVFRTWISGVVSVQQPPGSGGLARDDDASLVTPDLAVCGQPFDPSGTGTHVLSLGAGGSIIVSFDEAIGDGPGADFAVFENGFIDSQRIGDTNRYLFAELAFIEVGTTTNAWARFPTQSLGTNHLFNATVWSNSYFASMDVRLVDGFAGKHLGSFGTPFDLACLRDQPNVTNGLVDLNCIRFVRIVDIIGNGSSLDSSNRPIFDPFFDCFSGYPNPAAPSVLDGFDLRAIGVINSGAVTQPKAGKISWFAAPGSLWQPQAANSPAGPWTNIGAQVTGSNSTIQVNDTDSRSPRFYRVERTPVP